MLGTLILRVCLAIALATIFVGCAPGNFFCKGKTAVTMTAMLYNSTIVGDCGEGFMFSKSNKGLPLPPGLQPGTEKPKP